MIVGGEMPPNGEQQLSHEERNLIQRWIATGAVSNTPLATEASQLTQHDVIHPRADPDNEPTLRSRCTKGSKTSAFQSSSPNRSVVLSVPRYGKSA